MEGSEGQAAEPQPTTTTSTGTLTKAPLSSELLQKIESNRRAAQEKRKATMLILEDKQRRSSSTATTSQINAVPQVPKPKRQKTEEEILREAELKDVVSHGQVVRVQGYKVIDTGGGFLLDEKDLIEEAEAPKEVVTAPDPIIDDAPTCELCQRSFSTSFLFHTYDLNVCDACRDSEGVHGYITRTDAKTEFLLKDEDFDKREPALKFISRPNPHNPRWGDMKLYLRLQVEKRALDVWGSLDRIEAQRELLEENRVKTKIKKYNKKMNKLRMSARSSLYTRDLSAHTHEWGEETYDEGTDEYSHSCKTCGKNETYEKM